MKILIVENNPLIAEAIERAGEGLQLKVDCASDGWDAIEKLEAEEYAAIVIDADVPRHSGYGVITYLREEMGSDLLGNVIVMTGSDREDVRQKLREEGVRVITRSDEMEELTEAVRVACERRPVAVE